MNASSYPSPQLVSDLRCFTTICEELLSLSETEHRALAGGEPYDAQRSCAWRKDLLGRLNEVLVSLKNWRKGRQQQGQVERTPHPEIKVLLEVLQQMIVRILQLDRENQQALLQAGLLPARHLPAASGQQPSFVARLYSRHTGS